MPRWTFSSCLNNSGLQLNVFSQNLHLFTFVCTNIWEIKLERFLKDLSQMEQFNDSPKCVCLCECNACFCLKLLPHSSHENGLSSEWMRRWSFRCCFWLNDRLQMEQLNGLITWWITACFLKLDLCLKNLPHCSQEADISIVWIIEWLLKYLIAVKALSHISQLKGFSLLECTHCLCLCKALAEVNGFWHSWQMTVLWVLMWFSKLVFLRKVLQQNEHLNGYVYFFLGFEFSKPGRIASGEAKIVRRVDSSSASAPSTLWSFCEQANFSE